MANRVPTVELLKAVEAKNITGLSASGKTITYTKGDGSTGTITTQDTNTDTNTTYKLSKSGSTITLTGSDGATTSVADSNTTYSTMGAATSSAAGTAGLVPAPASGKQSSFLRGDGTWATPTNTTYSAATTSAAGLMSASDKSKLDGIASGAQANQSAFANVAVGSTTIAADAASDTLTLAAGSNVTLTPDATNDKVTIAATNTTYSAATTSAAGLMSASDKSKLDGITASADAVSVAQSLTSGTQVGTVTVNGTATKLYAPTNTDTHYTTGAKVGASSTATANAAASNGSVYLNVLDNSTVRDSHLIKGSGATTVTSDADGAITVSSTNTTYSSLKNPYALTVQQNGTTSATYDGSAAKTVNITASGIGAAASSHTHSYLPLSGGTMTGPVTNAATSGGAWLTGKTGKPKILDLTTASVEDGSRYDPIVRGLDAAGNYWNFGLGSDGRMGFYGFLADRTANGTDWSVTMDIGTGQTGATGTATIAATTAATLATARTIQTNLASTSSASFNGSANVTPGVTGTLPVANGGTGLTSAPSMLTNLASTTAASPLQASPRPGVTGTLPIANGGTGNTTGAAASCTGNAATATKLATARTISLTGNVTGSASFNGSANVSISATLASSGVTAGSYGPSANTSPAHGGTFSVPYVTVDAKGRVTSASTKTITLPSSTSSDPLDAWPVGSIYWSYATTSPASLFGGTWTQITNTFLWACDSNGTIGDTGGSSTHYHHSQFRYPEYYGAVARGLQGYDFQASAWLAEDPSGGGNDNNIVNNNLTTGSTERNTSQGLVYMRSGSASSLPPYMQVYAWRRTA